MFKSVFAKYVAAVMAIFTVGFALLLAFLTAVVNNYVADSKKQEVNSAVTTLRESMNHSIADAAPEDFESETVASFNNRGGLYASLFGALAANDEDLTLLVADRNGKVLYLIGEFNPDGTILPGMTIPETVMRSMRAGEDYFEKTEMPFAERAVPTQATRLVNRDGKFCGVVCVSVSKLSWGTMMSEMTNTVISAALLVFLAAMIAIYFISNRVISPLREMGLAAKKFAKGEFETRVSVRGRDEVSELAIAFNQMAQSLENLEKMRSTFIANISHDLRTPMTTIAGFIEEIREGVIPPEEQDHYLSVIQEEVKRLSRLVATLLDLSRIQAGDRKFVKKPFDICEMGRLILISFEQQIEEKGLDVEFLCDEDRMNVLADRDAIYQIFYNLCHNAIKFSCTGGKLRLQFTTAKEKKVLISVYNEGEGIPEEDIPYVFERFYKSDRSRGLDKSGLGLGLYISKTIIDAHGEQIWVESEEGSFCRFFFTLPAAETPIRKRSENDDER